MTIASSLAKRLALAACFVLAAAAMAGAQTAGDLLDKMKILLTADRDFFARVSVLEGAVPTVEFDYFRSDPRPAFLLYQTFPSYLAGIAYLKKADLLQAFNPECGCASETYEAVMRERAGVSFEELCPSVLAGRFVKVPVSAGKVGNEAAIVIVLSSPAEPDVRLSLAAGSGLPLRLEYLDGRGWAARTVEYLAYFEIENKYFPRRLRATARGGPTLTVELSAPSYNPLPDFAFTKAYIEELGK